MRPQGVHNNAVAGYKSRFPLQCYNIVKFKLANTIYATPRGHYNAVAGYKSRFPLQCYNIVKFKLANTIYATPRGSLQRGCRLQISFSAPMLQHRKI
jgi:hypothetical protein